MMSRPYGKGGKDFVHRHPIYDFYDFVTEAQKPGIVGGELKIVTNCLTLINYNHFLLWHGPGLNLTKLLGA
jgi:hypothetical protein